MSLGSIIYAQLNEGIMSKFLDYLSDMYYEGAPVVSDAEFDSLSSAYGYNSIGHTVTDGTPHLLRMYSLQKVFTDKDLHSFILDEDFVCTPKFDGAAISLMYVGGTLLLGLTRGDGNLGRDISDKVDTLVPANIDAVPGVQITGEIVAPREISNARVFAAGSLNLKYIEEFSARPLEFIAYDVQTTGEPLFDTYLETLEYLKSQGFTTALDWELTEKYPIDGSVYRINSNSKYYRLGFTSHHPRGSVARKELKEGVLSTLVEVVWQVGKSGVVSPVAILDPVEIDGATISRATLHNIQYIRTLNLEIGCQVEVIRSGEVIPRVVRRVDD